MNNKKPLNELVKTLIPWLSLGILIWLSIFISSPPKALPSETSYEEFSAERAMGHNEIISKEPHWMGSAQIVAVRDYIISQLETLGLEVDVQSKKTTEYFTNQGRTITFSNIITRIPGTDPTQSIALVAHYDTTPSTPGANDNGAAVSVLLETARALKSAPPLQNDVILIFTDGEEPAPRYGANLFVSEHSFMKDIGLVINFEALGRTGPSILIQTSPLNDWLIKEFKHGADYSIGYSYTNELFNLLPEGSTDFEIFNKAGVEGFNFAFMYDSFVYHSALDSLKNFDLDSLQHHGTYALSLVKHFGNIDLSNLDQINKNEAVYFSLWRGLMVVYPASWTVPFALLCGLLLAGTFVIGFRKKTLSIPRILLSSVIFLLSVILTTLLIAVLWELITDYFYNKYFIVSISQAKVFLIGFLALTLLMSFTTYRLIQKNIGTKNFTGGIFIVWWLLTIGSAAALPGISYLFIWPLLFAISSFGWSLLYENPRSNYWQKISSLALQTIPGVFILTPIGYHFFHLAMPRPGNPDSQEVKVIGLTIFFAMLGLGLITSSWNFLAGKRKWGLVLTLLLVGTILFIIGCQIPGIPLGDFGLFG